MADDNEEPVVAQRRPGRKVVRNNPAAASADGEADANQLFRKLIANATTSSSTAETMWAPDEDEGYVISTVKSREKEKVTVETESGQVCSIVYFFFSGFICFSNTKNITINNNPTYLHM